MTYEEMLELKKGLDAETTEPVIYMDKDDTVVLGDANNTEVKKHEYTLIFETENGEKVSKKYENIHILPRKRTKVNRLVINMLPYFENIAEDGTIAEKTPIELAQIVVGMGDEIYDICYDLARTVLEVPDELVDMIDPISALAFGIKLVKDNPAVAKESYLSFV